QASLALWQFPDDPGVLGIGDVWRRGGALFDHPGLLDVTPWSGRRPPVETALVRYVPSKRVVLRYEFQDGDRSTCFYGKVYGEADAGSLYAETCELWEWSRSHAPEVHLAQPLGCDTRLNAVWQASPGGEPLLALLGTIDLPRATRRVAAALAALHRGEVRASRTAHIDEEARKLERARAALLRFYPMLEREITATLDRLIGSAPPEPEEPRPIHGDFHCNQVLLHNDRVSIIDFDLRAMGDPLLDVARFLSRFRAYTQGEMLEADAVRSQKLFLSTYEILVPWDVDRGRLAWLMAALLINRQILKSVKKLSTGGPEPVAALLAAADGIAQGRDLT
ncbi:MAG: phosphotransferase family protein, partial [Candidatus Krumholzibacteriia bacterium]